MFFLNRKSPFFFIILALLAVFLMACQENLAEEIPVPETEDSAYPGVPEALHTYFSRFESEGAERGYEIDLVTAGIEGLFEDIEGENIAGTCSYTHNTPRLVTIDQPFWESASDLAREFIVFHELGHCYLDRDHRENQFTDGTCVSLMRSGVEDCRDNYHSRTRETYLDELFTPNLIQ